MPDLQQIRKKNLKLLIKQWEGPTNLAKKLQYSGPSYLSQLIGPNKPITEKTARFIERTLDLPAGWLDSDHKPQSESNGRVDNSLVSRVILSVGAALEDVDLRLSPKRQADLISLMYEHCAIRNEIDDEYITRTVKLLKG